MKLQFWVSYLFNFVQFSIFNFVQFSILSIFLFLSIFNFVDFSIFCPIFQSFVQFSSLSIFPFCQFCRFFHFLSNFQFCRFFNFVQFSNLSIFQFCPIFNFVSRGSLKISIFFILEFDRKKSRDLKEEIVEFGIELLNKTEQKSIHFEALNMHDRKLWILKLRDAIGKYQEKSDQEKAKKYSGTFFLCLFPQFCN